MSATLKSAVIGTGAAVTGSATQLLGKMADLTAGAWALLIGVVIVSTVAGALAALGQIVTSETSTDESRRRALKRAAFVLGAQFLIGIFMAATFEGDLLKVIPACLVIGWTGSAFLKRLAEKSGLTGDDNEGNK